MNQEPAIFMQQQKKDIFIVEPNIAGNLSRPVEMPVLKSLASCSTIWMNFAAEIESATFPATSLRVQ